MGVDENVIEVDVNGNVIPFDTFINGDYTSFNVTNIIIGTETLAGFNGEFSDMTLGFTGY